ncbi:MAG: hypothetical protein RB296_10735 [Acidobacteriota bacterium]|jgi:hypothetical protein|nr:hypothetical protein [Acidobacteriota bacterium]
MKHPAKQKAAGKKYEKPVLRVVNIAPGVQTLGIGCKMAEAGVSYDQPCVSLACAALGS